MTADMDLFLGEFCRSPRPLTIEELGSLWPRTERDTIVMAVGELEDEGLIRPMLQGGHVATELGRELWHANE